MYFGKTNSDLNNISIGKKTDYWISLNPESGDKSETSTEDGVQISLAVAGVSEDGVQAESRDRWGSWGAS